MTVKKASLANPPTRLESREDALCAFIRFVVVNATLVPTCYTDSDISRAWTAFADRLVIEGRVKQKTRERWSNPFNRSEHR